MPTFLEVAVNVPHVSGVFHYHLPPELEGQVDCGHLVVVPFGSQLVQGLVLRFVDQPSVPETRPVRELVDPEAVLTPLQLRFARHLSESTLAPLSACITLMLPPGLAQQAEVIYRLNEDRGESFAEEATRSQIQGRLLGLLQRRGSLRSGQIDQALPRVNWRPAARALLRRGVLVSHSVLPPPKVQPKYVRTVQLACPPRQALEKLPDLGRAGSKALERRQKILQFLVREPGPVEVAWIYAESGANLADLRALAERELVVLGESQVWRNPLENLEYQPSQPPALTRDQREIWLQVEAVIQEAASGKPTRPILLHGVTGSGKTEIYLQAVAEVLRQGKSAIILVPEISLTPQTVRRFASRFPGQVGLLHSGLSEGERYDTWRRARAAKLAVMVGPRSALFTPFANLGLIVIDEEHDESYYQSEGLPHYHAREAAAAYASLAGAVCLFGSATPDLTSTYRASQGQWQYLHLPARILAHRQSVENQMARLESQRGGAQRSVSRFRPLEEQAETIDLPKTTLVDMRTELSAGNRSIFSRALQSALGKVLESNEQAILFLNRRGSATYVFCRDCGHSLLCPRCDLPLTYHNSRSALVCHHCGYQRKMPKTCPQCGSRRIRQYGTGTAQVETELQKLYPQARLLRWDFETTRYKGAHEIILGHFAAHRADFLIGTQMLAKGLDLPLVTLVGVILADVGLNLPDYRTAERAFQVLTQVSGRAGRSPLGGQVILQTFRPDHYAIQAAAGHNYRQFYQREISYRRELGYPPFSQVVRLEYRHARADQAERAAQEMAAQIRNWLESEDRRATSMIGPVPCFFSRINSLYRWQIVLRGPDPASLLRGRDLGEWKVEVNPLNLL